VNKKSKLDLELMEGRSYIVGREGHIHIDSPIVSKYHAELRIIKRRIYLRDLNSTNGTFLVKGKQVVPFVKGFVSPLQAVVIGNRKYNILDLLANASEHITRDDATTEINLKGLDDMFGSASR
jgi:hypothetical protein